MKPSSDFIRHICCLLVMPIGSMYGIFAYIWPQSMVNVGKYTIHGSYGMVNKIPSYTTYT